MLLLFIDIFTELLDRFQNKKAYFCCATNINLLEIVNKTHFNTFYGNLIYHKLLCQQGEVRILSLITFSQIIYNGHIQIVFYNINCLIIKL